MTVLFFVLLLLGAICFGVEAFVIKARRVNLLALGLLLWILVPLIHTLQKL